MEEQLRFVEDEHKYYLGDKELISVTELMKKYGLAPNYDGVSPEILQKKAEHGKQVHEEIEEWIKEEKIGFTEELCGFIDYITNNKVKCLESEKKVCNDIVAGTIDLVVEKGKQKYIADIKTTYSLHLECVSWQISLYLYLYDLDHYTDYKGQCYHFGRDKMLKVVDVPIKKREDVEELMDCVRFDKPYKPQFDLTILNEMNEVNSIIVRYQNVIKEYEEQFNELKVILLNEMKLRGITQYKDDFITISYVKPTTRKSVDSKALKEKYPEIYNDVLKESEVKESIKITFKERNDAEETE